MVVALECATVAALHNADSVLVTEPTLVAFATSDSPETGAPPYRIPIKSPVLSALPNRVRGKVVKLQPLHPTSSGVGRWTLISTAHGGARA